MNNDNILTTKLTLETKQELNNINTLIDSNIIKEEFMNAYITIIEQLLSHFNQLLIKVEDVLEKNSVDTIKVNKEKIAEEFTNIKNKKANYNQEMIIDVYNKILEQYKNLEKMSKEALSNNTIDIDAINDLKTKINNNLDKINNLNLDSKTLEELKKAYTTLLNNSNDKTRLTDFFTKTNNILNANNTDIGKNINGIKSFDLFAKINDQIIDSSYTKKGDLTYALYTLENKETYYAIIKKEEDILILDQQFSNLPNLTLKKEDIIKACRTIINNAGIYYNINEFMRHIEMSYKTKMTKEIDDIILKYKRRLASFETILKAQFNFIDSVSLLVNHKECEAFPNITYNDVELKDYFQEVAVSSIEKEIENIIINIFLNDKVKTNLDTLTVLKTLYEEDTLKELLNIKKEETKKEPVTVNTEENIPKEVPTTNNITTNYEKVTNYLNSRVKELNLLITSPKINITITKEEDPLYKDINTVLDLHTALIICDKVYQQGQGLFAVTDYLKTGQVMKFTSNYGARSLATTVDRTNYLKILLANMIKEFTISNRKKGDQAYFNKMQPIFNFVNNILSKDNLTVDSMINLLLENEEVLSAAITNFDYAYLDNNSNLSNLLTKSLEYAKSTNNASAIKIDNILRELKK